MPSPGWRDIRRRPGVPRRRLHPCARLGILELFGYDQIIGIFEPSQMCGQVSAGQAEVCETSLWPGYARTPGMSGLARRVPLGPLRQRSPAAPERSWHCNRGHCLGKLAPALPGLNNHSRRIRESEESPSHALGGRPAGGSPSPHRPVVSTGTWFPVRSL